jgi:SAM-dependent methyltransferase
MGRSVWCSWSRIATCAGVWRKLRNSSLAQRVTAELTVVCAALPNLSFSNKFFDAVVICFVTSHLPRRLESMKEVFPVLRPGGVLAVLDHGAHADGNDHHRRSDCHREKQDHGTHSGGHGHHPGSDGYREKQDHGTHSDARGHHPRSDDHRTKQNCSSEERKDSALSWFWELHRFKRAMRAHEHMHGGTGLSFAAFINDITQAGFEMDILKTIEKEGTGKERD